MKKVLLAAIMMFLLIGCSKKPDVITTPSGLRYVEDTLGTGRVAKKGDMVMINFTVWVIKDSSNLFEDWTKDTTRTESILGDSKRGGPYKFALNTERFVKGSDDGIIGMKKGGTRTIIIPSHLAYGPQGAPPQIPPNSNIKVVVTLLEVKDMVHVEMWNVDTTKALSTKSGLKYVILQEGTGPNADSGKTVIVNYSGYLPDGLKFDSSIERDEPLRVALGQRRVMAGWEEGLRLFNKGTKVRLIIPPSLAYGPRAIGMIPANATLHFDIEVLEIIEDQGMGMGH